MDPSARRFLESMQAAGVRRLPRPGQRPAKSASPPTAGLPAASAPTPGPPTASTASAGTAASVLAAIAAEIAGCRACPLCETRHQTVPGEGAAEARIVFVGEGPGADEDRTGRPFVGRAGQLLEDIVSKGMKLRREQVYICNVVKCRPPGNRVPEPQEVQACASYLDRQIRAVAPAVLCALGATAARRLLGGEGPLGALRGRTHAYLGIPVVVTYHPAYLLRNPAAKPEAWRDIQRVMELAKSP
ncbi:MAG: uracil-DNA glycosylase [Planctomycetota bacterium]